MILRFMDATIPQNQIVIPLEICTSSWIFSISLWKVSRSLMIKEYSYKLEKDKNVKQKQNISTIFIRAGNIYFFVICLTCIAAFLSSVNRLMSLLAFTRTIMFWLISLISSSCCLLTCTLTRYCDSIIYIFKWINLISKIWV